MDIGFGVFAATLFLSLGLAGCRSAVPEAVPDISGTWTHSVTMAVPKNLPPIISASPEGIKDMRERMKQGIQKLTITTTIDLTKDHHFLIGPLLWAGTWSFDGSKIVLLLDKDYVTLDLLSGINLPKKRIYQIELTYLKSDHSLRGVFGGSKTEQVFRKVL